jgi:F-type H+-transporting ATPase subunit b
LLSFLVSFSGISASPLWNTGIWRGQTASSAGRLSLGDLASPRNPINESVFLINHSAAGAAAGAGASAAEDHGQEGIPINPLEFRTDLALWTAVVFVVLLAILGPLAWTPIAQALDRRERHLAEQFATAERKLAEAQELLKQYQQKLENAAEEAKGLIQQAVAEAEKQAAALLARARQEAEAEHTRRMAELKQATDQAIRDLVEYTANMAVEIAAKLLCSQLDPVAHRRLLSMALDQVRVAAGGKVSEVGPGGAPVASGGTSVGSSDVN